MYLDCIAVAGCTAVAVGCTVGPGHTSCTAAAAAAAAAVAAESVRFYIHSIPTTDLIPHSLHSFFRRNKRKKLSAHLRS